MKPYELTYIIASHITSEAADTIKKEVETFVQSNGGVIVKSEKTVPQSLAYPIKKNSSGFFVTLEFQSEQKKVKPLKEMLEKNTNILRSFILVKNPIKQMKERRTRKPQIAPVAPKAESTVFKHKKEKTEQPEIADIDKKLDEILSE